MMVIASVRAAEEPQVLLAVTEMLPLIALDVVVTEVVAEVPDQPPGSVHVYEVASLTDAMV